MMRGFVKRHFTVLSSKWMMCGFVKRHLTVIELTDLYFVLLFQNNASFLLVLPSR